MIFFRIMLISLVIWLAGFIWFIDQMNLNQKFMNHKYDAIIVLTGAKGRIDTGIKLLSENKARHLFISGVGQNANLSDLSKYIDSFSEDDIHALEQKITLGHTATSTEENAVESMKWIKNNNYNSIILVTSNYHMLRSLFLFQRYLPNIEIMPFYSSRSSKSLKLTFLEFNKYLFFIFYKNFIED